MDNSSALGKYGGGEADAKRERETASTGKIWEAVGDRYGERDKQNEQSRKR